MVIISLRDVEELKDALGRVLVMLGRLESTWVRCEVVRCVELGVGGDAWASDILGVVAEYEESC